MRTAALVVTLSAALLVPLSLSGCASASIKMKESLGYAKREQLVDEVKDTRNAQQKAKEQFASTLDEFKSITGYTGGDLERRYNKLKDESEASSARAQAVRDKIASVERIANAMFREWDQELAQYSSETLRGASAEQLQATRVRYRQLLEAMKKAESRMDPVITAFNDQILFLKHNLNARAIASLETTVTELETEISSLIDELNRSIDEANSFIQGMQGV